MTAEPVILGLGGTVRQGSSSERALRIALSACEAAGTCTRLWTAHRLQIPFYNPADHDRGGLATALLDDFRQADGLIVASPGYHGALSGLVKNALDYAEELAHDQRPYFDGLPIGCISVAYGQQAAVNTLRDLRDIAHALRGWPTPYGAALVVGSDTFTPAGQCIDSRLQECLERVGQQVAQYALRYAAVSTSI